MEYIQIIHTFELDRIKHSYENFSSPIALIDDSTTLDNEQDGICVRAIGIYSSFITQSLVETWSLAYHTSGRNSACIMEQAWKTYNIVMSDIIATLVDMVSTNSVAYTELLRDNNVIFDIGCFSQLWIILKNNLFAKN